MFRLHQCFMILVKRHVRLLEVSRRPELSMSLRLFCRRINITVSQPSVHLVLLRSLSTKSPSLIENAQTQLSSSLTSRFNKFQTSLLFAGEKWHDLTGYSDIKKLKRGIEVQEQEVTNCVQRMKEAKQAYTDAIRTRSEGQKEHNELLQRKNSWSSIDLERFTMLIRNDHSNSRNEEQCERAVEECEDKVEQARARLDNMRSTRYNEEQIWSDNMRGISSLGLMAFNILIFVVVQLGLEPWKRERLVGSFEDKVRQVVLEANTTQAQPQPQETSNHTFLTDADHAAEDFVHDLPAQDNASTNIEPQEHPNDETLFLTDADYANEPVNHGHKVESLATHEGLARSISKPRVGTSAMLGLIPSRRAMLDSLQDLPQNLWSIAALLSVRLNRLCSRMLSPQRSSLRVEDVTSACFASGVVGILLGLSFGRI